MPRARNSKKKPIRKVQRRFVVRQSGIHGRGVFALSDIPKGTRLIEYLGERMSHKEADRRYGSAHEGSAHTMLFAANDDVVIDATKWGSSARWINHSCTPNCEAIEDEGRVFIETRRAVRAGEELGYDYELIVEGRQTEKLKREHACYCGTRHCRGTMLGKKR
ncbi:MAG TPA: SET domain-containing protein-lysine N-methyltransferase [Burkholderiales bacterium]|nr:SET domain-containing protein-lysine N-methyltransferase [Burkholderiales bacterium]